MSTLRNGMIWAVLLAVAAAAPGQVTSTNSISLQAKLEGVSGPTVNLTVRFYDALVDGAQVGAAITLNAVAVQDGIVSVPVSPVDAVIFNGQTRYMGISVNGGAELTPRTLVTSVPYAMTAFATPSDSILHCKQLFAAGDIQGSAQNLQVSSDFTDRVQVESANFAIVDSNFSNYGVAINYKVSPTGIDLIHAYSAGLHQASPLFRVSSSGEVNCRLLGLGSRNVADVPQLLVGSVFAQTQVNVASATFESLEGGRQPFGLNINFKRSSAPGGTDVLRVYGTDGTTQCAINDQGRVISNALTVNGIATVEKLVVDANNDPAITAPVLDVHGTTQTRILVISGADVAEPFDVAKPGAASEPQPGFVVSIDPDSPGKLMLASTPYDKRVAGAISGANGLSVGVVMGKGNDDPLIKGEYPVAMSGRVYVWCDASFGAIQPGNRLTTSATPGHAMKVGDESRAGGAVIGKAMTGLTEGKGLVLVLVNLQ